MDFFYLIYFLHVEALCFIGYIDCINSMYALTVHSLHHKQMTDSLIFKTLFIVMKMLATFTEITGAYKNCNIEALLYLLFKNITILTFIAYLMKVIPAKRHAHYIRYLRFYNIYKLTKCIYLHIWYIYVFV